MELSAELGNRSIIVMAMMRASAAKKTPSRSDSANLRADAARNTVNASSPNSAKKPNKPNCPHRYGPTAVRYADILSPFIEDTASSKSSPAEPEALGRPIQQRLFMVEAELQGFSSLLADRASCGNEVVGRYEICGSKQRIRQSNRYKYHRYAELQTRLRQTNQRHRRSAV